MALFLRKGFRLLGGLLRLNVSKSGIGVSAGVKGARIGLRPDGSIYSHVGRKGLYHRKELAKLTPGDKAHGSRPAETSDSLAGVDLSAVPPFECGDSGPEADEVRLALRQELEELANKSTKSLREIDAERYHTGQMLASGGKEYTAADLSMGLSNAPTTLGLVALVYAAYARYRTVDGLSVEEAVTQIVDEAGATEDVLQELLGIFADFPATASPEKAEAQPPDTSDTEASGPCERCGSRDEPLLFDIHLGLEKVYLCERCCDEVYDFVKGARGGPSAEGRNEEGDGSADGGPEGVPRPR